MYVQLYGTAVPVRLYLGTAVRIRYRYSHLSVFTSLEKRQSGRTSGRQAPHLTFVLTAQLKPRVTSRQAMGCSRSDGVQQMQAHSCSQHTSRRAPVVMIEPVIE
eukprot:COSAG01_NODE_1037_length_11984_cov_106.566176_6_plen_104_part_00